MFEGEVALSLSCICGTLRKILLNNPSNCINSAKINLELTFNSAAQTHLNLCHAQKLKKKLFETSIMMQCNSNLQERR